MGNVPSHYIVSSKAEWAGREFYTAHDERAGQVVYLMYDPSSGRASPYDHPNLPKVQPLPLAGTGWLVGAVPEGDTLEDLRGKGALSEQDLITMLLAVVDGLAHLGGHQPPMVPSYLDPACVKRDWMGRWVLDYLLLAQAPEARRSDAAPRGIHPFGVLLYWLFTGVHARMTRVQVDKVRQGVSPALQFIMIQCLSRSYPGLAELRVDLARSSQEHDFREVAQLIAKQAGKAQPVPAPVPVQVPVPAEPPKTQRLFPDPWAAPPGQERQPLEYRKVPIGGPNIPFDDRPWALPERPSDGFRKFVVPPEPDPRLQRLVRWGLGAVLGLSVILIGSWALFKLLPDSLMPAFLKPALPVQVYPELARADARVGHQLPPEPVAPGTGMLPDSGKPPIHNPELEEGLLAYKLVMRQQAAAGATVAEGSPPEPVASGGPAPAPYQPPAPPPSQPPRPQPKPPTVTAEVPEPAFNPDDARTGGMPIRVYVNGRLAGCSYMFPHPRSPYMSLEAVNHFFGRNLYWVPTEGSAIRIFTGDRSLLTLDYSVVQDRLWLKLTPFLQEGLGIEVSAYGDGAIHFTAK